jgi:Fe2+ or Zn2+ uptake regulation protein
MQKAMLALLKGRKGHFTAERVLVSMRESFPTVCLATVYRNLDIFTREGKVRRISNPGGARYYEGNLTPHDHAVCLRCGKVSDVTVPGLRELVASNLNGEIVSVDMTVNFLCRECAERVRPFESD